MNHICVNVVYMKVFATYHCSLLVFYIVAYFAQRAAIDYDQQVWRVIFLFRHPENDSLFYYYTATNLVFFLIIVCLDNLYLVVNLRLNEVIYLTKLIVHDL